MQAQEVLVEVLEEQSVAPQPLAALHLLQVREIKAVTKLGNSLKAQAEEEQEQQVLTQQPSQQMAVLVQHPQLLGHLLTMLEAEVPLVQAVELVAVETQIILVLLTQAAVVVVTVEMADQVL
jgi:hypothetical protein